MKHLIQSLVLLCFLFASSRLEGQIQYKITDNEPNAWHWMASASLHTQNFNSANLRLSTNLKPVDWCMLSANAFVPMWSTAFSGDKNSGASSIANATAVFRWGYTNREKERVNVSSSVSESTTSRTTSTSYFEPELLVYSYLALRGGFSYHNTAQAINANQFEILSSTGTARVADTTWKGETRTKAMGLHAGIEWGRDSHANIDFSTDYSSGTLHPCYYARYYVDFLYLPTISYDNFIANSAEYQVNKRAELNYTQLGGRFGFEQNFRWFHWGAELGLYRRFGEGETAKLADNGYGYLNMFFGFTIGDWASAD